MTILTELRDPRISDVTVTLVEVSPDMRQAKVHVSVMGDEAKQKLTLHGLQNASGFLQAKIARRIDTRYTPRLRFVLDQGVKRSIEVSRILDEVLPRSATPELDDSPQLDDAQLDDEAFTCEPERSEATESVDDPQDLPNQPDQSTPDNC